MAATHEPPRALDLLAGVGLLSVQQLLMRAGLRGRVDGWRRAACVVLRGDASTFILSAFGLAAGSDLSSSKLSDMQSQIRRRLFTFLRGEPGTHIHIRRLPHEDLLKPAEIPSVALGFEPWRDGAVRFVPPTQWPTAVEGPHDAKSESPLLSIVIRVHEAGGCDVWMRCNHAGIDGVPAQELLSRLEMAWGKSPVLYPTPQEFEPFARPRGCGAGAAPDIAEVQTFLDFAPVIAWRKARNATLPEPMTLSAALMWRLSRHERFARLHIGTTVEVAASGPLSRGVGVVVARPGALPADGLAEFVREFNRQMELTRRRESAACRTLDAVARVHPRLAGDLLRHTLHTQPKAFGTLAITMIKDAKVFGAPIADAGHRDGFLAIGDVGLPTADGRRVGCVCIKGPRTVIAEYPELLRKVLTDEVREV